MPPPTQSVANPMLRLRRAISKIRLTMSLAPVQAGRMSQPDPGAVHVGNFPIRPQFPFHRQVLGGKGFVAFDELYIPYRHADGTKPAGPKQKTAKVVTRSRSIPASTPYPVRHLFASAGRCRPGCSPIPSISRRHWHPCVRVSAGFPL